MKNGDVKVGDKIVDNGRVFRVFKIEKKKENGEEKRIAHFRPYYKKGTDTSIVSSIPIGNIGKSNIRLPVSKKKVKKAKKALSKKKKAKERKALKDLKSKFSENEIVETAEVVKLLWDEREERDMLPPTKKKLFKESFRSISEEFAFVTGKKLDKAKRSVKRALKN